MVFKADSIFVSTQHLQKPESIFFRMCVMSSVWRFKHFFPFEQRGDFCCFNKRLRSSDRGFFII